MEANWGSWPPKGWVFFVRSLSYFGQILELFLEINNFLSNSVKMEQKQHEITLFLPINGKFDNKNYFKTVTLKKNSNFPILFLEFLCWNYLQQGEFFAQNGPWVFSHLALSFLKTHKKMPALTAAQFKWNPISNRYLKAEGSWGASLCDNQLCKMDKERVATSCLSQG